MLKFTPPHGRLRLSFPRNGLTVESWEFWQEPNWLPLRLICKRFPVFAHSPWKSRPSLGCGVSRMEFFPSLESQMSRKKKRAIVSSTPWCYLVSVHVCLFITHAFSFLFWGSLVLFQLLIGYLLMFSQTKHPLCQLSNTYIWLCFLDKYEEAVWNFFHSFHYFKTAIKTPTRTRLCSIGNKPIIFSLPYNWIIEAWCHFGFHASTTP